MTKVRYITMSLKELGRVEVIEQVISKRITQKEGAKQLQIGKRQIIRLCQAYRASGAQSLLSKKRGKPSNNQLSEEIKNKTLTLFKKHYADFGPTLAHEKLTERHELQLSVESVRQLMMTNDLWQGKKKRAMRVHQTRARRPCYGELVQIDGSPHPWFEDRGDACTLLVFVDDATGKLMGLHFEQEESTQGYFDATRQYVLQHGRPVAFYSDKHGIFRVNIKEAKTGTGETQFSRAMRELDILLINANSPQAKGRVERMNAILQDRLVKELRLAGISDIASANAFVPKFIEDYNRRFAVAAASPVNAHRQSVPPTCELDRILCHKHTRVVTKNLEVHYCHKIYQIQVETPSYTLRGARIVVCDRQGHISLLYKQRILTHRVFDKGHKPTMVASSKEINRCVEKKLTGKPASNHPWRRTISADVVKRQGAKQ